MMAPRGRSGVRGFTLIELLVVVVILGVVSAIAIPNLRSAIHRADAAKIVADMTSVRRAVLEYREDHGSLPGQLPRGRTPGDLIPYLGEMPFTYKDVIYDVDVSTRRGVVEFEVYYQSDSPTGAALAAYRRPGYQSGSVSWTPRKTRFLLLVGNR